MTTEGALNVDPVFYILQGLKQRNSSHLFIIRENKHKDICNLIFVLKNLEQRRQKSIYKFIKINKMDIKIKNNFSFS